MASTDARPVPIKNAAFRAYFDLRLNTGALNSGAAGLDSEVSKDGGTMADCTNEATEIATSSGHYYLDLTSTEMNADSVVVQVKSSTTNAVTRSLIIYPQEAGDIKVQLDNGVTHGGSTAVIQTERIIAASTTTNEPGIKASGNGTAAGVQGIGGATGAGILGTGGGTSGSGIRAAAAAGNSIGLELVGNGSGEGLKATGGATGEGAEFVGGATSGVGLLATGTAGNSGGIRGVGQGSASGIAGVGGATGAGVAGVGGATSGAGISGTGSAGNSLGVAAIGNGTGAGFRATGGATGPGIEGIGGATSGSGIKGIGTAGNSAGVEAVGQGSAGGLKATGGATGAGLELIGGATSGNALKTSVTAPNDPISELGIFAAGTLNGTHSSTTADLGTNAPSVDIAGQTLLFPDHKLAVVVDSYNTGTGVATFQAVAATLVNGNDWYLVGTPQASPASPVPANVVEVIGDPVQENGATDTNWGGAA